MTYFGDAWNDVPKEFLNDYQPTKKDISLVKKRIKERSKKLLILEKNFHEKE